jgi:uncharacterized membrane protein
MNNLLLFGIIILLLDIPFVKYIIAPKYYSLNMALDTKMIYALCAYTIMILAWFLIEGDVLKGALVGLVIYGTYAFTLAAILPGYTLSFAMTEIIWGTILFTVATFLTKKVNLKFKSF